jgi:glutaminyl-peptide cyclotransferase
MKKNNFRIHKFLWFISLFPLLCCTNNETVGQKKINEEKREAAKEDLVQLISPARSSKYIMNSLSALHLKSIKSAGFDSVKVSANNNVLVIRGLEGLEIQQQVVLPVQQTGRNIIKVTAFLNNGASETEFAEIVVFSDIEPELFSYKILNTYPHRIDAYTQGLVYENGLIYEGTGTWGQSRLMKYELGSEELLGEHHIPAHFFGEGIEVFGDKLIQLTYKSQTGFIYDKNTFEKLREFKYPYSEGWGITFDGEKFIMSDGSHNLYFLDTEYLTEIGRVEVYDNNGMIDRINELEYVDGFVYANVYFQDYVICIDPKTGKVLEKIDLSNLLPVMDRHPKLDVLNGIAYNPDKGTFYVTGKNWPKLFELKFVKE